MKPAFSKNLKWGLSLTAVVLAFVMVAWGQQQSPGKMQRQETDTTPVQKPGKEKKIVDLNDELDEAFDKMDWEKFQKKLNEGLEKIDAAKIKLEIDKAFKEIDFSKMQNELSESLAKIDMEKIQKEVKEAMSHVNMEKINEEISQSLKEIDIKKIQLEVNDALRKVKEVDLQKVQEELEKIKPTIEKSLKEAKSQMEKAKLTIQEYKSFVNGLEKDSLINKEKGYTLKNEDGVLYINGTKAPNETYQRYKSFLDTHKNFNINNKKGDFNINLD
ncbi:MAG: hypothetical protein V9F46_09605 [Chitinophagaceae bacterium]